MYHRPLQVEHTESAGWVLYSLGSMDTTELANITKEQTGVLVAYCWRVISLEKREIIPEDQKVKAMHIEVEQSEVHRVTPILQQFFRDSKTPGHPLCSEMRLVPEMNSLSAPVSISKAERLRNRQKHFQTLLGRATTWELTAIDFSHKELDNRSLRNLISTLLAKDGKRLFHAVHKVYQKDDYCFNFRPAVESEARKMVGDLLPYLLHTARGNTKAEEALKGFFTPEAVERAAAATWDAVNHCCITRADLEVSEIPEDDEYSFADVKEETATVIINPPEKTDVPKTTILTGLDKDQDSVSTFQPQTASMTSGTSGPPRITPRISSPNQSVASDLTSLSEQVGTLDASMSTLQQDLGKVQGELKGLAAMHPMMEQMIAMMKNMPSYQSPPSSEPTEKGAGGND